MNDRKPRTSGRLQTHIARSTRVQRWTLAIRWAAAIVFVIFGAGKFANHASELASFRLYGLPAPDAFTDVIGALEIVGGLLLAGGLRVRAAAVALAADMVGAIVVSGIGHGETISLTLAPALLAAMVFVFRSPERDRHDRPGSPPGRLATTGRHARGGH